MSYITLRGRWSDIVLNVHASTEDRNDDRIDFYEGLDRIFYHFSKYHIKILLPDFSVKVG